MNLQTTLYCLVCQRLTPHWRRWFRLIGWHYQCAPCESQDLKEYEKMATSLKGERTCSN